MNETEQERELAANIYQAIQAYSGGDARSLQAKAWQVGVSDLGYCSERTRRMLKQEDPGDTDMLTAFLGTAIGEHAELAIKQYAYPDAILQAKVELVLDGGSRTYRIPGHPDVIIPGGILLDGKTSLGLSIPARSSEGISDRQRRFQRHGYAKAAAEAGLFKVPLSDVQVGNFYIDRSGEDKYVLAHLEPYDPAVVDEMTEWLEEVVYNFTHDQAAPKEPPREVCAVTCGFFDTCRAYDTDTSGLLTDEVILGAISQYAEGQDLASEGQRLKNQAKAALAGVTGFANVEGDRYALRWTHVNESLVPEHSRRGYDKIDLKKVK
jgi:hypothetical protein